MRNFKIIILALVAFIFIGCDNKVTNDFKEKYGANTRYYCDDNGFLLEEYVFNNNIGRSIVRNDAKVPTRCTNNVEVKVKETVATGALSGSVQ